LFRRSWVLGATGYCDSLKQFQKWSFFDLSDAIANRALLGINFYILVDYHHQNVRFEQTWRLTYLK
jgi:hypothetical protein